MSDQAPVGDVVAAFLENCGIATAYGVVSIHNMPILDAIARRGAMRFVPSRGEAGAGNMADAHARVTGGLGAFFTSTGTAAGNAAGAMVEAQTAGTPLLHITGQIDSRYLDRDCAYIHEARDQLAMLGAVSKAAYRVRTPETALGTLKEAVRVALMPPSGPVSVEIPIDIQGAKIPWPADLDPPIIARPTPSGAALDRLAGRLRSARRPLLWLGGGARGAGEAVARLAELGFAVVTSTQGRGTLPEDHPHSLGAFTATPPVEDFYRSCDAALVVGSRLRGNETLTYRLQLPRPLYQIDADPRADSRCYHADLFVHGDAEPALQGLADRLESDLNADPGFAADIARTRADCEATLRRGLGPYDRLVDMVAEAAGRDFLWVRDVTISNSTWGNRLPRLSGPRDGVHALGGGIGQGLSMAIGAALASPGRKTFCLVGDGGLQLNLAELATAVEEKADIVLLLMNSQGYGVIRNIQDARFGGRHFYVDILTPDFGRICAALGMPHARIDDLDAAAIMLAAARDHVGPAMIEFDMAAIGDFAEPFAGPPSAKKTGEPVK